MITKEISLKLWEENQIILYNIQGEVDSRQIKASFIDQDGNNLSLSEKNATFYARKPDGTQIYNDCIVDTSANTATVTITSQMVSALGVVECEFQIFDSSNILLKANGLKIVVTSKGDFSEAITSTSEYDSLTKAINEARSFSNTALQGLKINGEYINKDSNNIINILTASNNIPTFEKGTWTPQFTCPDGTNPTYTTEYTYSHYYRIENLVYITFFIHTNITNAGSGNAYIEGLPFTPITNTNRQGIAISAYGSLDIKTAFYVSELQPSIKIGILSGGSQTWQTGKMYIGGSGCYLKA